MVDERLDRIQREKNARIQGESGWEFGNDWMDRIGKERN
jgi:hypothetical protein